MEVDCRPESVPVAETSRVSLELLDHGIEGFGSGVGGPGHHGGDDAVEVLFDHPGHFFDRLQTRTNRPAVPFLPATPSPSSSLVVPEAHRMGLDRPGSRCLQIGRLQAGEVFPRLVGHAVGVLQPKVASLGQRRVTQRSLKRLVLSPAHSVDRITQMLGDMKLVEGDLGRGINYVTPHERHIGQDAAILARRHALYQAARDRHPQRWSRDTRNWSPTGAVWLNPEKENHPMSQAA